MYRELYLVVEKTGLKRRVIHLRLTSPIQVNIRVIGIPGEDLPNLLVCLLTPKPDAETADNKEAHLLAQMKKLYTTNKPHLGRLLQFDEIHQKVWFREHRFSVLVAWLILKELLNEQEPLTPVEEEHPEATIAEWVDASEQLDLQAFLAGYEMEELVRAKE